MLPRTVYFHTIVAVAAVATSLSIATPVVWAAGSDIPSIDTNNDGQITPEEARAAAEKKFEKLDKLHTGKLEEKDIPPMEKSIREMARHDKDHAIDKDEYMAGVDAAFKEADPKGSGVLNAAALKTKAGKKFLKLVE